MRNLITIISFMFCIVLGYFVAMAWLNISEGKDIFTNTPLAGYLAQDLDSKVLGFLGSIKSGF